MRSINLAYPQLLDLFPQHLASNRSESASFLIWYLENYYRLDTLDASDAVCDQSGDRGVDAIYINDSDQTITIFQSKISQSSNSSVGDRSLRDFLGTLAQFETIEKVDDIVRTSPQTQLAALIKRSGLTNKLGSYKLQGEFVINLNLDENGSNFLSQYRDQIKLVGKELLASRYISNERYSPERQPHEFDILGVKIAEHIVDVDRKAVIAPVKASELVKMEGILDQSLFEYNVRGSLGKTKVNKDLSSSIRNNATHKIFPLFHNGITIITKRLDVSDDKIIIEDYYVVNGCQSISALYDNKSTITSDLKLLTKFVKLNPSSVEATMITEFSNNQNGVRSRDFKSNNAIQIRLRQEFLDKYQFDYSYEIKRGETSLLGDVISNEEAGLYLMAFDHREPWATHRKYEIFDDKHSSLFGRPEVTADRIVMLRVISEEIKKQISDLTNELFAKYILTQYLIMYVIREQCDLDQRFNDILHSPDEYMRSSNSRNLFRSCIAVFVKDIIIDLNLLNKELDDDFDYRGKLRDTIWVKDICKMIVGDYKKSVSRGRQRSFSEEWSNQASAA